MSVSCYLTTCVWDQRPWPGIDIVCPFHPQWSPWEPPPGIVRPTVEEPPLQMSIRHQFRKLRAQDWAKGRGAAGTATVWIYFRVDANQVEGHRPSIPLSPPLIIHDLHDVLLVVNNPRAPVDVFRAVHTRLHDALWPLGGLLE